MILRAPLRIDLTAEEMALAEEIARQWYVTSYGNSHGCPGGLEFDRLGAAAEVAFRKAIGASLRPGIFIYKGPDYGTDIQVRASGCRRAKPPWTFGRLLVRHDDNPDHRYVLVVGNPPHFLIQGWIWGHAAMADCWLDAPAGRPQEWFVPQHFLNRDLAVLLG